VEVLLIRHGDPDYANDTLTELGHAEARKLAESIARRPLISIYVSPLGRARDTMRYTADRLKMEAVTHEWLREVGAPAVAGVAGWNLPGSHILGQSELPALDNWFREPLLGVSFFPFYQNIARGFDAVMMSHGYEKSGHMYRILKSSDDRIAFFCHYGTILTLLSYLLHWPLQLVFPHSYIDPTGVTRLRWHETDGQWAVPRLQVLNDLSHLARV